MPYPDSIYSKSEYLIIGSRYLGCFSIISSNSLGGMPVPGLSAIKSPKDTIEPFFNSLFVTRLLLAFVNVGISHSRANFSLLPIDLKISLELFTKVFSSCGSDNQCQRSYLRICLLCNVFQLLYS